MTDRLAQARAEAERRTIPTSENYDYLDLREFFMAGAVWADANPQPHTITREQFERAFEARFLPDVTIAVNVLGFLRELGIEVTDDEPDIPETCAACGEPAEGFAMIGDERYCHPDDGPSCYGGGTP